MIKGMRMDLKKSRYENFDELYLYCYYVAGTISLMSVPVMGITPNSKASTKCIYNVALTLRITNQLTNILRDVGEEKSNTGFYTGSANNAYIQCPSNPGSKCTIMVAATRTARLAARYPFFCNLPNTTLNNPQSELSFVINNRSKQQSSRMSSQKINEVVFKDAKHQRDQTICTFFM
ncbi:hypothetical protein V8G54_036670 [Vigna mungo]|uniref:15-cis-phytoene synthase n=1 Tax=Vigna mungo TaxID=3915 RepID=A0AAQ3MH74_VIGMU